MGHICVSIMWGVVTRYYNVSFALDITQTLMESESQRSVGAYCREMLFRLEWAGSRGVGY